MPVSELEKNAERTISAKSSRNRSPKGASFKKRDPVSTASGYLEEKPAGRQPR
jgi:hypothetical protein